MFPRKATKSLVSSQSNFTASFKETNNSKSSAILRQTSGKLKMNKKKSSQRAAKSQVSGRSSTKSGKRLSEGRTKVKTNNKKKIGKKFNLTLDFSKINQQMMANQISSEEQVSRNLPSTIPNLNQYNMAA